MKELLGKKIKEISFLQEGRYCQFVLDNDIRINYEADGDCCSHSYFSDIINKDNMLNAEVLEVIEKEERDVEPHDNEDYVRLYGYTIKTSKGYGDIEFRNDSNGYYGGSCELVDEIKEEKYVQN